MMDKDWNSPIKARTEPFVKESISQLSMADKEKINYLSGSLIDDFSESVWTMVSGDIATIHLFTEIFTGMCNRGQIDEMYDILRLQYGMLGLTFPDEVLRLKDKPEEKRYFLFSFLLDFDDVMTDYITEQS
jgi:hypothetical protein